MSRARTLAVVASLSLGSVLVASLFREPSPKRLGALAHLSKTSATASIGAGKEAIAALPAPPLATASSASEAASPSATNDPLSVYLAQSVYPPTSRPLRAEQDDLIHPDRRYDPLRQAASEPRVTFLLTADRLFVTGDEETTVTLEVWRGEAPAAVQITRAEAFVEGAQGEPDAPPSRLDFAEDGLGYACRFSPARLIHGDDAAFVSVRVSFTGDGSLSETSRIRFQVTPPSAVPARFSGQFRDRIEDGSLVVEAGIDVEKAGRYAIDANLWGKDDRPVAWARFKGALTVQDAWVPLVFFGKAIRDAEPSLPLRLGELRGARLAEGKDPDLEAMAPYAPPYEVTLASLTELSEEPWESPKKRAMIRMLSAAEASPGAPRLSSISLR